MYVWKDKPLLNTSRNGIIVCTYNFGILLLTNPFILFIKFLKIKSRRLFNKILIKNSKFFLVELWM